MTARDVYICAMIGYLKGVVLEKQPAEVLLDVHGVGYVLAVPVNTSDKLPERGGEASLFVHTNVREDAIQLFGFATSEECTVFRMLIAISGNRPKIALGIISSLSIADLREHVIHDNLAALSRIPGIGKKTAERLVIELREKLQKLEPGLSVAGHGGGAVVRSEAMLALTSLGYTRLAAEMAIRNAVAESEGASLTVEQLVKNALRHANA